MAFCSKCNNIYEITQINDSNINESNIYVLQNKSDPDLKKFDNIIPKGIYICRICGHKSSITPGTVLFVRPSKQIVKTYSPININKIYDPTFPVTRNYICPNEKCDSHNDSSKREAIFYRIPTTYDIQYICKTCTTVWSI